MGAELLEVHPSSKFRTGQKSYQEIQINSFKDLLGKEGCAQKRWSDLYLSLKISGKIELSVSNYLRFNKCSI